MEVFFIISIARHEDIPEPVRFLDLVEIIQCLQRIFVALSYELEMFLWIDMLQIRQNQICQAQNLSCLWSLPKSIRINTNVEPFSFQFLDYRQ